MILSRILVLVTLLSDFDQNNVKEGTFASAEIALVCGLKVRVDCQHRLCMNSDADGDEELLQRKSSLVGKCYRKVAEKLMLKVCNVMSEF